MCCYSAWCMAGLLTSTQATRSVRVHALCVFLKLSATKLLREVVEAFGLCCETRLELNPSDDLSCQLFQEQRDTPEARSKKVKKANATGGAFAHRGQREGKYSLR